MALENLYQCTPSQLQTLPEKLADAFTTVRYFKLLFLMRSSVRNVWYFTLNNIYIQ